MSTYFPDFQVDQKTNCSCPVPFSYGFPRPYYRKPLDEWSINDVRAWLEDQGEQFQKYMENFSKHGIDGFYLQFLTAESLKGFVGIEDRADREILVAGLHEAHHRHVQECK